MMLATSTELSSGQRELLYMQRGVGDEWVQ